MNEVIDGWDKMTPHERWQALKKYEGFDEPKNVVINHSDFLYAENGGKGGYPIIIFERSAYIKPTSEQIEDYRKRKAIVEALGGVMKKEEYRIAGRNEPFTEEECQHFQDLVQKELPDWKIREVWNGAGCYSFSISLAKKEK